MFATGFSLILYNLALQVLLFFVCKDELELRYKLHSSRDVEVLGSRVTNLADGRLHTVIIRRQADTVSVQVGTHKYPQQIIHTVSQITKNTVNQRVGGNLW